MPSFPSEIANDAGSIISHAIAPYTKSGAGQSLVKVPGSKPSYEIISNALVVNHPLNNVFTLDTNKLGKTDNFYLPVDYVPTATYYMVYFYSREKSKEMFEQPKLSQDFLCKQDSKEYMRFLKRLAQGIGGGRIVVDATPMRSSSFQHDSTCCAVAISAIEQPAAKSGRITF